MKQTNYKKTLAKQQKTGIFPATPGGRARFTRDWFLYGAPLAINYDAETQREAKGESQC